jgi:hypothetical protein
MAYARRHPRSFAAVGLAALAVVVVLAFGTHQAGAVVIGKEHYSGTDSDSFDDCGFTLDVEVTFHGVASLRVLKGGQAFLARDNFSYVETYTNPETGGWFVIRGNALFHETKGTRVGGDVYKFVQLESGQPFTVVDSDGNVVIRDRGNIRRTILFDTLGDGVPGGIELEELDLRISGPHPGFGDEFDFCAVAADLTGA